MKAIVYTTYGSPDVLEFKDVEKPTPKDNEVLVKIHAAAVTVGDVIVVGGKPFPVRFWSGLFEPKHTIPGKEMAGRVEAVGKNVTQFQPGDEVFGDLSVCGLGAFAEYVAVPEHAIALKPVNMSFEQAAAVAESAIVALQGLRDKGKIQPGQKVLINGASGGVGTFAVQIAKSVGAEVTAVCSTKNVARARSLGADHVIDYTKEDFTRSGQKYDLLFNVNGSRSWSDYKRVLKPDATFVLVGGPKTPLIGPLALLIKLRIAMLGASQKFAFFIANFNREDMLILKDFLETGKLKPFVERTYPLAKISDAMRHLGTGHAQGKIVVQVAK